MTINGKANANQDAKETPPLLGKSLKACPANMIFVPVPVSVPILDQLLPYSLPGLRHTTTEPLFLWLH